MSSQPNLLYSVTTSTSSTILGAASVTSTVSFLFPNANTAKKSGGPVTVAFSYAPINQNGPAPVAYTYSPVTSIFFTDTTTTQIVPAVTESTSTTTVIEPTTTTIAQSTEITLCTTGTSTVTAPRVTATSFSTISFRDKTITIVRISTTTTTAACITGGPRPRLARDLDAPNVRRQQNPVYRTDYCPAYFGPPEPTYVTTSTVVALSTSTTTVIVPAVTTSTTVITATPVPATTTICSNVQATVTITPTRTKTAYTIKFPKLTTTNKTYVVTKTVFAGGRPKLCTPPPNNNHPPIRPFPVCPAGRH